MEAAQLKLDPVDIEELDSLSATTVGARYDAARMAMIDH